MGTKRKHAACVSSFDGGRRAFMTAGVCRGGAKVLHARVSPRSALRRARQARAACPVARHHRSGRGTPPSLVAIAVRRWAAKARGLPITGCGPMHPRQAAASRCSHTQRPNPCWAHCSPIRKAVAAPARIASRRHKDHGAHRREERRTDARGAGHHRERYRAEVRRQGDGEDPGALCSSSGSV